MEITYIMFSLVWFLITGYALANDFRTVPGIFVSLFCGVTAVLLWMAGV